MRWIGIALVAALATGLPAAARPADAGATAEDPELVAAGDIADCIGDGEYKTATIIDALPGATVAVLGDIAYVNGTPQEFQTCYEPSWGRHKARTRPSPGNHEYGTPDAAGYFGYFGASAGPAGKGWYSYDLGSWHVVVLNSNCTIVDCTVSSEQLQWLRADLTAHPVDCTLAYWHHPLFTSGTHAGDADLPLVRTFWNELYARGVELILNGHDHDYERFTPQTPAGVQDLAHGIREFVVGTGGANLRPQKVFPRPATSEAFYSATYGVLKLVLQPGGYAWEFLGEPGTTFTDSGTGNCHAAPDQSPPEGNPTVSSSHTSAWSNDTTVDVTWSGASDSGSGIDGFSFSWTQAAGDSPDAVKDVEENVGSATSAPLVPDGEWWFHLRTKDNAGNWSAAVHLGPFRIDTAPPSNPALASSHVPGDWSNDDTVEVGWTGASDPLSGVDGYAYSWTQQATSDPGETKTVEESVGSAESEPLDEGSWWFHLRTRDNAGNWSAPVHRGPFKIDTTAPTNPTLSSPSHSVGEWSNEPTVVVEWGGEPGHQYSYDWSQDQAGVPDDVAEGPDPDATETLADGSWWFLLRTRDAGGSWSGTARFGPFLIDTAAPTTVIAAGPPASTTAPDAHFEYFASEPASFRCALDGAALGDCSPPTRYAGLAAGQHVFRVQARDRAGNLEPAPREYRWTVVAAPPPPPPPPSPPQPPPVDPPPKRPPQVAPCVVPRVIGRTVRRARIMISRAGCRTGRVRRVYSARVRKGFVLTQGPRPGRRLARGTQVGMVVSLGKKPAPRRR